MIENRIVVFDTLGQYLHDLDTAHWKKAIGRACHENPWFTRGNIELSISAFEHWLKASQLKQWLSKYSLNDVAPKKVAIIMAGNIPLVGFHDLLCVLIAGHQAIVKLSSKDRVLMNEIINTITAIDSSLSENIIIVDKIDTSIDAVIATGNNNSFRQFQYYFGKYPSILRKSRTSVAVLDGNETLEERKELAKDVFLYFGLGCRNVTKIYVPLEYHFELLADAFVDNKDLIQNHKYANNYEYHKVIYALANQDIIDYGFVVLKEDESLHSPVSVLHYEYYQDKRHMEQLLQKDTDTIQCVVGNHFTPFGQAQFPQLTDYADGIDTLSFLATL